MSLTTIATALIAAILLSAVTYRICRVLILDKIGEPWRDKFYELLSGHPRRFTIWLQTLMLCPYCLSVHVSFYANLFWYLLVDDWPSWAFPVFWLTSAAGALVFWHYIDAED
jgi:predicted membrane-bound dolichyl-phosphate-mannose-protein mannosyltransferase